MRDEGNDTLGDERRAERAAGNEEVIEGQKEALELAVHGAPLAAVLEVLVRTVEAQSSNDVLGSILLLDAGGERLRLGAAPSLPAAYNAAIDGIAIGPGVGSCGTAAFTRQTVVVSDIQTDPLWAEFKGLAGAHGLRACWSTPILSSTGGCSGPSRSITAWSRPRRRATARSSSSWAAPRASSSSATCTGGERAAAEAELRAARERAARPHGGDVRARAGGHRRRARAGPRLRGREPEVHRARRGRPLLGRTVREALPELEGQGFFELLDERLSDGRALRRSLAAVMLRRGAGGRARGGLLRFRLPANPRPRRSPNSILVVAFEVTELVRAKVEAEAARSGPRRASRAQDVHRQPAGAGVDGAAGRPHRLLQSTLVRIHGDDVRGDAGLGLGEGARPGAPAGRRRALETFARDRGAVRDGVHASRRGRRAPLVSDARRPVARRDGKDRPLVRHEHEHRRHPGSAGADGRRDGAEPRHATGPPRHARRRGIAPSVASPSSRGALRPRRRPRMSDGKSTETRSSTPSRWRRWQVSSVPTGRVRSSSACFASTGYQLRSAEDLVRLSEAMIPLGGFEGAVGAMLGVSAVLRGAKAA